MSRNVSLPTRLAESGATSQQLIDESNSALTKGVSKCEKDSNLLDGGLNAPELKSTTTVSDSVCDFKSIRKITTFKPHRMVKFLNKGRLLCANCNKVTCNLPRCEHCHRRLRSAGGKTTSLSDFFVVITEKEGLRNCIYVDAELTTTFKVLIYLLSVILTTIISGIVHHLQEWKCPLLITVPEGLPFEGEVFMLPLYLVGLLILPTTKFLLTDDPDRPRTPIYYKYYIYIKNLLWKNSECWIKYYKLKHIGYERDNRAEQQGLVDTKYVADHVLFEVYYEKHEISRLNRVFTQKRAQTGFGRYFSSELVSHLLTPFITGVGMLDEEQRATKIKTYGSKMQTVGFDRKNPINGRSTHENSIHVAIDYLRALDQHNFTKPEQHSWFRTNNFDEGEDLVYIKEADPVIPEDRDVIGTEQVEIHYNEATPTGTQQRTFKATVTKTNGLYDHCFYHCVKLAANFEGSIFEFKKFLVTRVRELEQTATTVTQMQRISYAIKNIKEKAQAYENTWRVVAEALDIRLVVWTPPAGKSLLWRALWKRETFNDAGDLPCHVIYKDNHMDLIAPNDILGRSAGGKAGSLRLRV